MTIWDDAREMVEYGWSVIPLGTGKGKYPDKKPLVEWRAFQEIRPSDDQIDYWEGRFPDAMIAVITGAISGVVVVDCDNDDAIAYAKEHGVWSPVRVKTRRGLHLYFKHPQNDRRFGPRVGSNSTGVDWPEFSGLDFRGDGSYAVTYSAEGYSLDCDEGFSIFELEDMPEWEGWPMSAPLLSTDDLDLSSSRILSHNSEWDRTAAYIASKFPGGKIPSGLSNGRNERVAHWAGECVAKGIYGEDLHQRVIAFMDEFYHDRLDESEWKATCASVELAERRNHPERIQQHEAEAKEGLKEAKVEAAAPVERKPLLRMGDAVTIAEVAAATPMLVEPFLPVGGIVHVSGYTGHGKSMVVSHLLTSAAAGRPYLGPFEFPRPISVLYLDYENGRATLSGRLSSMLKAYGDPAERLGIWTPWLENDDMPLFDKAALNKLKDYIKMQRPDVVVIDTARSAYPGLAENDADAWAPINRLMKRLQGYGIATILLHHKNKPQNGSFSREAGSTAQLNVVETQIYVTQVYRDKARAEAAAGLFDSEAYPEPVWPKMEEKARATLGPDWVPVAVYEMRYGKVRDWSDNHDPVQWLALCNNIVTGDETMIGSASTKQRARRMHANGKIDIEIARTLGLGLKTIRGWIA